MEATIWIKELEDYVIFTAQEEWQDEGFSCDFLRQNKIRITDPELTFPNIQWDTHLYTNEENKIIEQYLNLAEEEFKIDYSKNK